MKNLIHSEEMNQYFKNRFNIDKSTDSFLDHPDSFWTYLEDENLSNSEKFVYLKNCFPQLLFPISRDINKTESYRNATLKGNFSNIDLLKNALNLKSPETIEFVLYNSFCGKIPVLIIQEELDFNTIIQALLYRNVPVDLPKSMGASLIIGANNWKRIDQLKLKWQLSDEGHSWNEEFKNNILPFPIMFKDNIIVLSKKCYSNISAKTLELENDEWENISLKIRLEHECTHLYTLNKYCSASNNLHDELIADYIGIISSQGSFNKHWMLHFMGLENFPEYRFGGRLQNYLNGIDISSRDFNVLTTIIYNAIETITLFDKNLNKDLSSFEIRKRIDSLCRVNLINMSSNYGAEMLLEHYNSL